MVFTCPLSLIYPASKISEENLCQILWNIAYLTPNLAAPGIYSIWWAEMSVFPCNYFPLILLRIPSVLMHAINCPPLSISSVQETRVRLLSGKKWLAAGVAGSTEWVAQSVLSELQPHDCCLFCCPSRLCCPATTHLIHLSQCSLLLFCIFFRIPGAFLSLCLFLVNYFLMYLCRVLQLQPMIIWTIS